MRFADNLRKYVKYLETKNREMQENNKKKSCASQVDDWQFLLPTEDSSSSGNATEAEVDERVSQLLDSEDPNLIWDLRVAFLEECK